PVTPGGTGSLGFPLSFAPSRAGPGNARQGGDRPGHCLDYVPGISQPPSTYSLTTCDLTSHELTDLGGTTEPTEIEISRAYSAFRVPASAKGTPAASHCVAGHGPDRLWPEGADPLTRSRGQGATDLEARHGGRPI